MGIKEQAAEIQKKDWKDTKSTYRWDTFDTGSNSCQAKSDCHTQGTFTISSSPVTYCWGEDCSPIRLVCVHPRGAQGSASFRLFVWRKCSMKRLIWQIICKIKIQLIDQCEVLIADSSSAALNKHPFTQPLNELWFPVQTRCQVYSYGVKQTWCKIKIFIIF